jgi:hypothetical protein
MRETKTHTDAFNEYYLMGDKRSLSKLAAARKVTDTTCKKWSREFNWQERIRLRDIELSKREIKTVDDAIISTKADMLKLIEDRIKEDAKLDGYATALIGGAKEKIEKKELEVESIKELAELMRAHQGSTSNKVALIKAALLLLSEPDSRAEHSGAMDLNILKILKAGRANNDNDG